MKILVLHSDIAADAPPEERDTLIAAEAVTQALRRRGHDVVQAAFVKDQEGLRRLVAGVSSAIVFNLVEGIDGLGRLAPLAPQLLGAMGVRFTGVGAEAMEATNDKPLTKACLRRAGLATPDWCEPPDWSGLEDGTYIVKSALEDASLGLDDGAVVAGAALVKARAADCARRHGGRWFAEAFIDGREFNVAILEGEDGPEVLPMAEMRFEFWPSDKPRIVGYDAKWDDASLASMQTVRAFGVEENEPALARKLRAACEAAWHLFGLTGFARVDFRVAEEPFILEINANPCISPDAGFAAAAARAGMGYDELIARIVAAAAR